MPDSYLITDAGPELVLVTVFRSPSLLAIEHILGELTYWIAIKGERLGVLVDISVSQGIHTPLGYVRYARFLLRHPEVRAAVYGGTRLAQQQIAIINQMGRSAHQLHLFADYPQALEWLLTVRQTEPPNSRRAEH